jgi:trimeric autotransporter adhesin
MKRQLCFIAFLLISYKTFAQSVTIDPQANTSGIVNVQSTNKGVLVPNMTTAQRTTIASAQKGLLVFDSNTSSFWFYNGVAWNELINNNYQHWILKF